MPRPSDHDELPVLPLKETLVFPDSMAPLSVGRPKSISALRAAVSEHENRILLVAQRDAAKDDPVWEDIHHIGTKAVVTKVEGGEEGGLSVTVVGEDRVELLKSSHSQEYLTAEFRAHPLPQETGIEIEALSREVLTLAGRVLSLINPQVSPQILGFMEKRIGPARLAYAIASFLRLEVDQQQKILEAPSAMEALTLIHQYLSHEIQVLEVRRDIATHTKTEMNRQEREYLLRQQLHAIQDELGDKSPEAAEVSLLSERIATASFPPEVRKAAEQELARLEKLPPAAAEHSVIRTYLELLLDLPWLKTSEEVLDFPRARRILDEDHFDLRDVKDRILEHLVVLKLNPKAHAPILCFIGPPGVGKTSLGKSIARALGRSFERMSLGGLHDEGELRGHRRTYVAAMPGRIIQAIRRAGVTNPLLMLDEIDKMGNDFRGDPTSALLEILDPAQNFSFRDNYLDLSFDLSGVLFITTANSPDTIPPPLLDRMETLRLAGYTEEEKIEIARRYLISRQLRETGLPQEHFRLTDEEIRLIVARYTREAGVRQLERTIGRIARKVALEMVDQGGAFRGRSTDLDRYLGPPPFFVEQKRRVLPPGVAAGLAWTEAGGDVLYVEAALLPEGKGLLITGNIGPIMKESVEAAHSYLWSHAANLGIQREIFKESGVHVHVPAGAIPKDGPSAGITITAALASLYAHQPARSDTALSGEITLTGLVLPVGGIKEKVLAARRALLKRVILPKENEKDLRDLPEYIRQEMEFVFVDRVEEVLSAALPRMMEVAHIGP